MFCVELLEMMLEALFNDDKSAEILDRSPPGWNKTEVTGDFDFVSMTAFGVLK